MIKKIYLIILTIICFSILFSFVSIKRHENFQSQGCDLALYDQIIWLYSQGKRPYSTFVGRLDPADRFRPILLFLVPFYWLKPDVKNLLIAQSIILASGILPAFLLAQKVLKKFFVSYVISLSYILFIGIQSFIIDDFHEIVFLPPLLLWIVYFYFINKKKLFFLFLFLFLLVKEQAGFLLAFVSFYLLLFGRNKRSAFLSLIISLFWSILIIWVVMPSFGEFSYVGFVKENERLDKAIINYLIEPLTILRNVATPVVKIKTIFISFAAFGFFPLFYPEILIPVTYQFLSRFLDQLHSYRWTVNYHFSGELASLMIIGVIFAFKRISSLTSKPQKIINILSFMLLIAVIIEQLFLPVPLKNLLKKDFYKQPRGVNDIKLLLESIPRENSIATQNNLAPHLSQREKIYILPEGIGADLILIDLRPNQDQWNFYTLSLREMKVLIDNLIEEKKYYILKEKNNCFLLRKNN